MSGVKTNTESGNDGWPTGTTEITIGVPEIVSQFQKKVLTPDYKRSPEARMDLGKARINHLLADQLRDFYYATRDPRIAAEAHEHYQWALDLVNDKPLQSAGIHYSQAVLYHHKSTHELQNGDGTPAPELVHSLRLAFSYAERIKGRKHQVQRRFIADGVYTMADNFGIDLFGNGGMKMADIEARLSAMANPEKALGSVATEQTTEVIEHQPDTPWFTPKESGWGFDTRDAEPLLPYLSLT